ncbi:MAG TPA: glycoside hydrolase family 30 beta sandwich domain-containing protein [Candidatus Acidoferrum sp.]|jgi:glucosylceramidase
MKSRSIICLLVGALALTPTSMQSQNSGRVQMWLTNPDRSALFAQQDPSPKFNGAKTSAPTIEIDDHQSFQTIDGFGFALTGGSAQHLAHMNAVQRAALLKELFGSDAKNIGISYLRVSIGSSDLNDHVYSYDDLPASETDPELAKFSIAPDRTELLPVLKQILAINPAIKILGSPWSAPPWMKTNNNAKAGSLKTDYYATYANYFVKYLQVMKAEGITLDAITIQNEPLNDKNTPSMLMSADEEALFIKDHLGPAFKAAGIHSKIILYDHNCDVPEYPLSILKDSRANPYVDGSGFHLYGGEITTMSAVHNAFPQKNLYFTEFMAVEPPESPRISIAKPVEGTFIGALQNWSRNVLLWNLAANSKFEPHTDNGGCPICQGAVTIDGNDVSRNIAYYATAHFSKFVRPGSVRIASTSPATLPNVAFKTQTGKTVLVVVNNGKGPQDFSVKYHGRSFKTSLFEGAVATYVW